MVLMTGGDISFSKSNSMRTLYLKVKESILNNLKRTIGIFLLCLFYEWSLFVIRVLVVDLAYEL